MMTLRDLINKLLGRETASANTARERLQLVLAHPLKQYLKEVMKVSLARLR